MKTQRVIPRDAAAATRAAQAADLRASGMNYEAIAKQVGYANKAACYNAVQRELERHTATSIEHYRNEELAILDALQAAVWPMIVFDAEEMEDDKEGRTRKKKVSLFAVDRIIAIRERRAKLLGLDTKGDAPQGGQVLIREYGVDLKEV